MAKKLLCTIGEGQSTAEYDEYVREIAKRNEGYFSPGAALFIPNPEMRALVKKYQQAKDNPKLLAGIRKLFAPGDVCGYTIQSIKIPYTNGLLDGKIEVKMIKIKNPKQSTI